MRVGILAFALLAGCGYEGVFVCDSDAQCRHGGVTGTCEAATTAKYCLFPDPACAMGQRWDEHAGEGYDTLCLGEAPARPFGGPDDCPAEFTGTISGSSTRYALMSNASAFKSLLAQCDSALSGATHPANVKSIEVLTGLQALYATNNATAFIGLVQAPTATGKRDGWVNFDGTDVDAALWASNQPDDGGTAAEGKNENFGEITTSNLNDVTATKNTKLICACDGVAVPESVDTILTALGVK